MTDNNSNVLPYVANSVAADWVGVRTLLGKVISSIAGQPYWTVIETPFELNLAYQELPAPDPERGLVTRGRLFWQAGEIRFRYDGSLPVNPYRLTLVAETDSVNGAAEFNSVDLATTETAAKWKRQSFKRYLWGTPLSEYPKQEKWFVSRIPNLLSYPGLAWDTDKLPVLHGVEYYNSGLLSFYRFTKLATE